MLIPIIIVVGIGLLSGIMLTIASKFMAVNVNETAANIHSVLPGANCGACGFAGCAEYAKALADKPDLKSNLCTVGGTDVAIKISTILGVSFEETDPQYARVKCRGTFSKTLYVMDYKGLHSCAANKTFYRGRGACPNACIGFGDCITVCEYGAITIYHGIATIDKDKCRACGKCVGACPNALIEIATGKSTTYVLCSNHEKGRITSENCSVGCIGCGKCTKVCKFNAIEIEDNLAVINPEKCKNCGLCIKECPMHIIRSNKKRPEKGNAV